MRLPGSAWLLDLSVARISSPDVSRSRVPREVGKPTGVADVQEKLPKRSPADSEDGPAIVYGEKYSSQISQAAVSISCRASCACR